MDTGLLREVGEIVRERQLAYGPPTDHHTSTAAVWTVLLRHLLRPGAVIPPAMVGVLYAADKLVRETNHPKRDNRADVIGYMLCSESLQPGTQHPATDPDLEPLTKCCGAV